MNGETPVVRLEIIGDSEEVQQAMRQLVRAFGDQVMLTGPRAGLKADGFVAYGTLAVQENNGHLYRAGDGDREQRVRCCAELGKALSALRDNVQKTTARLNEEQQQIVKATTTMNTAVFELHTRNVQAIESALRICRYTMKQLVEMIDETTVAAGDNA